MFVKFTLLVLFGALCAIILASPIDELNEKTAADWERAREKCKGEANADELEKAIKEKTFPPSFGCFVGCALIEMNILTKEGAFNQTFADNLLARTPEKFKDFINERNNKLKQAVGNTLGKCESGKKLIPVTNELYKQCTHSK